MANSVVKVTDIKDKQFNDSLYLLVDESGTVTPDKDTVENFLKQRDGPTNIQIMKINKSDKQGMEISVNNVTYVPDVLKEEIVNTQTEINMEEIARNLHNFRLDHDYTPYILPCEDKPRENPENEVPKAIAIPSEPPPLVMRSNSKVTLLQSITITQPEGNAAPDLKPPSPVEEKVPEKEEPPSLEPMVDKSEEENVSSEASVTPSKGKSKVIKTGKKEKTKKKDTKTDDTESDFESYDEEDFDFDVEDDENDSDFEVNQDKSGKSIRKSTKRRKSESKTTPKSSRIRTKSREEKTIKQSPEASVEAKKEEEKVTEPINKPEEKSAEEQKPAEEAKPVEKKPKREKKIPKPIPDDFALFSTPDIIRRVGGKEPTTPSTPSTPEAVKPAKITQESRSKSADVAGSPTKIQSSNRQSLDSKDKNKDKKLITTTNVDKSKKVNTEKPKDKTPEVKKNDKPKLTEENVLKPEEMPNADEIGSIILGDPKAFAATHLDLDQEMSNSDPNNINLDATGLDLDPSLLENLNNDEISEDILYQVAQSLVSNPELQNVIDKGINEGVLPVSVDQNVMSNQAVSVELISQENVKGTQIVRPNGKIVVIPPIERPTTRSRNKKKEEVKPAVKPTHKPLDEEHVSGNELDSSGEEEDESEDDPNKLWCICNQPHNNRFMICCDTCEEWYHGKCVNITKSMGQQMEAEGKEWICLFCKDSSLKRPLAAARRIRKASRNSRASTESNGSVKKSENVMPCVVCQKPARKNSIYCSEACILAHAQGVERVFVFEKATGKVLTGNKAPNPTNLEQWLKEHKGYQVLRAGTKVTPKAISGGPLTQGKLKIIKNEDDNGVSLALQKKGVNLGIIKHAAKQNSQQLQNTINTAIKNFKLTNKPLVKPTKPKPLEIPITKVKALPTTPIAANKERKIITVTIKEKPALSPKLQTVTREKPLTPALKEKLIATPKEKIPKEKIVTPKSRTKLDTAPTPKKQENIRENVQKTVYEQLLNRLKASEDVKLTDEEVKNISTEIESQLFKCFGDTGQKYRNKYRSLIFNIKDAKNHTLWRRICEKSIGPYELVRLSPDDMASQELAKWRENEAKHSLDMIKKSELELLNCNRQYVLKTHKGEQVVEDERVDKNDNADVIKSLTEGSTLDPVDSKSDSKDRDKKGGSKHGHKDKKSRDKNRKSRSSSRERSRKKSRSRDRKRNDHKKHSRDRDRHRKSSSHKSSRHKKDIISTTDKLDKKSKEILESLVDNKIVPPLEDRLWGHVSQEDIVPAVDESDSDHEPSSTVTIPTPPRAPEEDPASLSDLKNAPQSPKEKPKVEYAERSMSPPPKAKPAEIWSGIINMIDVAQISISAHEVSGDCSGLGKELAENLDIVGRISPDTVWEYIGKMKCSNSKGISLIRLQATNVEERMPYLALYSYLSSRDRLGVVKSTNKAVKDFYIYPLAPQKPIPQVLLPINGPGFEESRSALLLGIIVRDKRKARPYIESILPSELYPKKSKIDVMPPLPAVPPPVVVPPPLPRSYTPPPAKDPRLKIPVLPPAPTPDEEDEPYSPGDSSPDAPAALLEPPPSIIPPGLTSLTDPLIPSASYSTLPVPGAVLPSSTLEIQRQVEELNKKIEAEKSEITSMTQNIVSASTEIGSSALANIALPSNLQQILDSIKTIGDTTPDTKVPPPPIPPAQTDLTIPLMIPKTFTRPLNNPPPIPNPSDTIPLNLPTKSKAKVHSVNSPVVEEKPSVLGSLSEEDLIRKAAEMLGENEVKNKKKTDDVGGPPSAKKAKHEISLPPIPGLEDEMP